MKFAQILARHILENWEKRPASDWTLQGFGMLRVYLSKHTRLHVWDSRFAVPNVTTIHDHPWGFESEIISGRLKNTIYRRKKNGPNLYTEGVIVCGVKPPTNGPIEIRRDVALGDAVMNVLEPGDHYNQSSDIIHSTSCEWGTVTVCRRIFGADTEHAHVFWPEGQEWVSAEPREALPGEVRAFVEYALDNWTGD